MQPLPHDNRRVGMWIEDSYIDKGSMATQPLSGDELRARIQAAMAISQKKRDVPRRFELIFNRTKLRSANPRTRLEYQVNQSLYGVLFTTGQVVLERPYVNTNAFETFSEMCDHFSAIGAYEVTWLDE